MTRRYPARLDQPVAHVLLRSFLVVVLLVDAAVGLGSPTVVASAPLLTTAVSDSPFSGSGARARVTLLVSLNAAAELTVTVVDYDGHVVRTLVDASKRQAGTVPIGWDGRDRRGHMVADGPYRLRAVAHASTTSATIERWVTKAPRSPYPRSPGAIVVAINPGHGGSDTGAVVSRTRESDLNLDIALRLRRMLEAAGVKVVMTRASDRDVNRPAVDRNGDGRVNHMDELIARNDIANLARADLVLNIHNNATACRCGHGTEVFVNRSRPWSAENLRLGTAVLAALIRRLQPFESRIWTVKDRGIGTGDYVSLRPSTAHARRPALMPAILGESLYLDRRPERARLRDPKVRTAIAAAYFDGVTEWLANRKFGIHYAHIEAPRRVPAGGDATVRLRITNTGYLSSSSWRLEARVVRRVPVLDGSGTPGRLVGSVALPKGIGPGTSADVAVGITMPAAARQWLLKLDIVRRGVRLSDRGVVQPQMVVVTVTPGATPEPIPEPTPEPTPEPSGVVVPSPGS